jgi:PAS domain S-box-containing protein
VELEAARARYFDFYDQAPVGYCTINEHGLIVEANLTAGNLFGVVRDTLLMQPIGKYVAKEYQDTCYLCRKKLYDSGEPQSLELQMVKKDGTLFWAGMEAIATQDVDDLPVCRLVITDITERKKAEKELRNLNNYNRSLIEENPDPLIAIDNAGKITDANLASEQVTGYLRQELIGTDFSDCFIDPEKARQGYQQVLQKGMVRDYPLEIRHHDGHILSVLCNATVIRDDSGTIRGVLATARDITERRRAEEEKAKLEAVNRHLQKSASLGRMAGAIAHHFNNKLHVVMGHLDLAKVNLARGDTCPDNLTAAMLAAGQAAEVSKMMLTYLGQVSGKREPLDLSETCRKILVTLQAVMPKNVVLETDMQSPGPTIKADAKHIQQILSSLVTNAWESVGACQAAAIRLTIDSVPAAEIPVARRFPINWQPEDSVYACLEVRDNGCGITNGDLEEVFSPFFSTKFTGRGLGLSMVLGLVQAYGGVVTVLSSLGKGSVFRVFLPLSAEPVPRQPDEADRTIGFQAGTVLLVDDDEIVVDITGMMLAKLGFTVLCAGNGIEALELFQKHRQEIRLVLCDVSMPRMDGWETLSALRQIAPAMPVILASGYSEEQVMDAAHPERPQAFLGKPYDLAALKNAIGRTLAG